MYHFGDWEHLHQHSVCLHRHRSAAVACIRLILQWLLRGQDWQCPCLPTPPITSFPSSTLASRISSQYVRPPPKDSARQPQWTWLLIFQVWYCLLCPHFEMSKVRLLVRWYIISITDTCSFSSSNNRKVWWIGGFSQWNRNNHYCSAQTCSGKRGTRQVLHEYEF